MYSLEIPHIKLTKLPSAENASTYLDDFIKIPIEANSWPNQYSSVKADFIIAHTGNAILLKYNIKERYLLASAATNGDVNEDSCVELFISLDGDENYYNLEFNCLGWCKIGYGNSRENRNILNSEVVELISSYAIINSSLEKSHKIFSWEITLVIPIPVFSYSAIQSFIGIKAEGNFYKCGDGLPQPHYLTWNPIKTQEPDFHRPEYFGKIEFG